MARLLRIDCTDAIHHQRCRRIDRRAIAAAAGTFAMLLVGCSQHGPDDSGFRAPAPAGDRASGPQAPAVRPAELKILYPLDGALFPPEIVAPTFRWQDDDPDGHGWQITFDFQDAAGPMSFQSRQAEWTPSDQAWETIKERSLQKEVEVTLRRADQAAASALSEATVTISTSQDEVGAPLFFREVNLPFLTAVKDPAAHIRWRFGSISSKQPPPIVLEKLPVCGNCHSFSADGSTLAMEVDSGNDKGSYAIAPVEKHILLDQSKIITWSDYRREEGDLTFGLLCQASPSGRYVVGTVKDRALAVYRPELAFSQLFFLVKGILAIYDRQTKVFRALPGADDPQYVQTNATWSPDGKTIVFARSKAYSPKGISHIKAVLVPREAAIDFLEGGRKFRYDLYRIPFNDGKGGTPEPIEGASNNGMSNYFPKFSPDGKWIVFCKADSFMLLQPDSQLYILPAQGGKARRLSCNTPRMNSWHSWSPNGRWLVFSSKAYTPYTQLFLTHIDDQGHSSAAVVLSRFTSPERAANIPEFANIKDDAIRKITSAFLDDENYLRAALEFIRSDDLAGALPLLRKSLELNPDNVESRVQLAAILIKQGQPQEARAHLTRVLQHEPDHTEAHYCLARILHGEQRLPEAADQCRQVLQSKPDHFNARMTLGLLLLEMGDAEEGAEHLAEAVRINPKHPFVNYYYGHVLHRRGQLRDAAMHYQRAIQSVPNYAPALLCLATIRAMPEVPEWYNLQEAVALGERACEATRRQDPSSLEILAGIYAAAGQFPAATKTAAEALRLARLANQPEMAARIEHKLALYKEGVAKRQQE